LLLRGIRIDGEFTSVERHRITHGDCLHAD
jgi:hypothetical protein